MLIIVQKRLIKLINGRVISMSKSEKTLYAKKGDIVIDHFNENIINRPDPHSQLKYDFDFRKKGDNVWRYLNSSDDCLAFAEQEQITITLQQRFKIIESISKDGIVIIGIKEDDNGQFTSRDEALDWLRTNHEIRE